MFSWMILACRLLFSVPHVTFMLVQKIKLLWVIWNIKLHACNHHGHPAVGKITYKPKSSTKTFKKLNLTKNNLQAKSSTKTFKKLNLTENNLQAKSSTKTFKKLNLTENNLQAKIIHENIQEIKFRQINLFINGSWKIICIAWMLKEMI
jgi:hypothetical protein